MRVAKPVVPNVDDDRQLRILSRGKRIEARIQLRARIVLFAAHGMSDKDIAEELGSDRRVAARWRARFLSAGIDGLMQDATRPGRPRTARATVNVQEVVRLTLEGTPKGATHMSGQCAGAPVGCSLGSPLQRQANDLLHVDGGSCRAGPPGPRGILHQPIDTGR